MDGRLRHGPRWPPDIDFADRAVHPADSSTSRTGPRAACPPPLLSFIPVFPAAAHWLKCQRKSHGGHRLSSPHGPQRHCPHRAIAAPTPTKTAQLGYESDRAESPAFFSGLGSRRPWTPACQWEGRQVCQPHLRAERSSSSKNVSSEPSLRFPSLLTLNDVV